MDLFERLRAHGLELGVDDYLAALQALRSGYGVGEKESLRRLCRLVWVKGEADGRVFDRLYAAMVAQEAMLAQEKRDRRRKSKLPPKSAPPRQEDRDEATGPRQAPAPAPSPIVVEEPVQTVQAIRHSAPEGWEARSARTGPEPSYFPVTRRQMKQCWRYLRRPVREGPPAELDVPATLKKLGREGILLEPVLVPPRKNRAELVLLIDQGGSMVPFHALLRQLVETARRGGRLRRAGAYYFHDVPSGYLYTDPVLLHGRTCEEVLGELSLRTVVLIVSDAGAARGGLDKDRIAETGRFLGQLGRSVRRYAWLNPLPQTRWPGTSAGLIADRVPMFEMSRPGLDAAIAALRGQLVPGWRAET